ncbi:MAG: endolytic transglycosylase MltG [Lachnospiraceae bacterium]|nr:endolytic transglycosylase MltG [Lachnospiraceae bacterium]
MGFIVRASILAIAILVVYKAGQKAYDFGFRVFTEEAMTPAPGRDVAVTIVSGDSTMDVGRMLEEKGLIRDSKLFYVQKKCSVYDDDIKPGFYTLNTSMTAEDMFAIIAGRKDAEEGEGEDSEGEDSQEITIDTMSEGESALDKASGEWEGTESLEGTEEEEAIHDPYAEGGGDEGDDGAEAEAAEEGGGE